MELLVCQERATMAIGTSGLAVEQRRPFLLARRQGGDIPFEEGIKRRII